MFLKLNMEDVHLKPQKPTFEEDAVPKTVAPAKPAPTKATKARIRPPPIDSVNVEEVLGTDLDSLKSLDELPQLAAMAIFRRLVADLLGLTEHVKRDPGVDLRDILFGGMEMLAETDPAQPLEAPAMTAATMANSDSIDSYEEQKGGYPTLLSSAVEDVLQKKRDKRSCELSMRKTISNQELEIPLRKISRIDTNFEQLDSVDEVNEADLEQSAGKYVLTMDQTAAEAILKRFYLKQVPALTVDQYLDRINRYLTPSTGATLTAAYFLFNLAFNIRPEHNHSVLPLHRPDTEIRMQPINTLNVFRIILSVLRVSLKLIEDKNYKQAYYCKITGLQHIEDLLKLELASLYALDFNVFVNESVLTRWLYQYKVFHVNVRQYLD